MNLINIMKLYSTNDRNKLVTFREAVIKGISEDGGLFMPLSLPKMPEAFFERINILDLQDIAFAVCRTLLKDEIPDYDMFGIIRRAFTFTAPLVNLGKDKYVLELFHGPTLAFKDFGARFLAETLSYFNKDENKELVILVATSGDTGSAVANGFLGVEGIHVYVLYPKGLVSKIQESQFTTLGQNITAIEIDGTFDDCQRLVKEAFLDEELNQKMQLTSANSINVARFLPQTFYYFYAFAQLRSMKPKLTAEELEAVICVPSGNFGNITAGLFAKKTGLPVKRFIAANNRNDIFLQYLKTGIYTPKPSVATIANAMDVGDPSNFVRILDLYGHSHEAISSEISGVSYTDEEIGEGIRSCLKSTNYLLDPHGACGYLALKEGLKGDELGVFLETAHPAKFAETVENIIGGSIEIPEKLQEFMKGTKQSIEMGKDFEEFKNFMLNQ